MANHLPWRIGVPFKRFLDMSPSLWDHRSRDLNSQGFKDTKVRNIIRKTFPSSRLKVTLAKKVRDKKAHWWFLTFFRISKIFFSNFWYKMRWAHLKRISERTEWFELQIRLFVYFNTRPTFWLYLSFVFISLIHWRGKRNEENNES